MSVDEKILRALSNECQGRIVEYLYDNSSASYSELMRATGFNISESGRFSYHLKKLINAGLVRKLLDSKYALTLKRLRVFLRESIKGYSRMIIYWFILC